MRHAELLYGFDMRIDLAMCSVDVSVGAGGMSDLIVVLPVAVGVLFGSHN